MNDRELLELAARAAGMDIDLEAGYPFYLKSQTPFRALWNPLTDDGDALRLAVKLKLDITFDGNNSVGAQAIHLIPEMQGDFVELHDGYDDYAATRRAIVLAAAEIGKFGDAKATK